MKFVLNEPPQWTGRTLELRMEKPGNNDDMLEVFHGDNGEKILEISVEQRTRNVAVNTTSSNRVVVDGNAGKATASPAKAKSVHKSGPLNIPRNWEIKKLNSGAEVFRCWLNNPDDAIELPVLEPGELCPKDEPNEVYGQDEMLFTLVLGIKLKRHTLLSGPTGIGKTTVYRWLAKRLGYNFVVMPIARGTQDRHLLGDYAPTGPGLFEWMDGPVTTAARLSREHPTILVFEELNRIGNVAEFSRVYSLLDDTKLLELSERRSETGSVETIEADKLYVGASSNPADDDAADYLGVKELDPAFNNRFKFQPKLSYPSPEIEVLALRDRVNDLHPTMAKKMVEAANRVREAHEVRFPLSFRELEAWGEAIPFLGYDGAAEVGVISKAPTIFRPDLRNLLRLQGTTFS